MYKIICIPNSCLGVHYSWGFFWPASKNSFQAYPQWYVGNNFHPNECGKSHSTYDWMENKIK